MPPTLTHVLYGYGSKKDTYGLEIDLLSLSQPPSWPVTELRLPRESTQIHQNVGNQEATPKSDNYSRQTKRGGSVEHGLMSL